VRSLPSARTSGSARQRGHLHTSWLAEAPEGIVATAGLEVYEADPRLLASPQFRGACPEDAVLMVRPLREIGCGVTDVWRGFELEPARGFEPLTWRLRIARSAS
jgi:hypothetical protein